MQYDEYKRRLLLPFYKFYKFGEWSPSIFSSDFTVAFTITGLESLFLISLKFYYIDFWNWKSPFAYGSPEMIVPIIMIIILINYFAFIHDTRWKTYIKRFDKVHKNKNLAGTWVIIGLVTFVLGNFALAAYIMGKISGVE